MWEASKYYKSKTEAPHARISLRSCWKMRYKDENSKKTAGQKKKSETLNKYNDVVLITFKKSAGTEYFTPRVANSL